jgi:hypothetical protein
MKLILSNILWSVHKSYLNQALLATSRAVTGLGGSAVSDVWQVAVMRYHIPSGK